MVIWLVTKLLNQIIKVSKSSQQNSSETVTDEHDK